MMETAYFAGGCFWCITPTFQELTGVESVTSGYSGGDEGEQHDGDEADVLRHVEQRAFGKGLVVVIDEEGGECAVDAACYRLRKVEKEAKRSGKEQAGLFCSLFHKVQRSFYIYFILFISIVCGAVLCNRKLLHRYAAMPKCT